MLALRLVFIIALIPLLIFIANGTLPKIRAVLLFVVIVTSVPLIAFDLMTKARHHRTQTRQRSLFDVWLRGVEIVFWIAILLDLVLKFGKMYTMALIASAGGLTAIHIVTGKWRRQARRPLLGWPPSESGIQHWRKQREQRLRATDGPV